MAHDFAVKVMLSCEEFVAFKALCEEEGISQSGKARALIKSCIREYAKIAHQAMDETGQD
jgi:hypothetical protein